MCGIAGIIKTEKPIDVGEVAQLFKGIQYRGYDATGCALLQPNGRWRLLRIDLPFSDVRAKRHILNGVASAQASAAILHVRAATHGSPHIMDNNHPIVGREHLMIHNGIVHLKKQYEAVGDTDTEQLLRHIEHQGVVPALKDYKGWAALAMVSIKQADEVVLWKDDFSPLWTYRSNRRFMFSSIKENEQFERVKDNTLMRVDFHRLQVQKKEVARPPAPKVVQLKGNASGRCSSCHRTLQDGEFCWCNPCWYQVEQSYEGAMRSQTW